MGRNTRARATRAGTTRAGGTRAGGTRAGGTRAGGTRAGGTRAGDRGAQGISTLSTTAPPQLSQDSIASLQFEEDFLGVDEEGFLDVDSCGPG
jgi:hypothetical protein